MSENEEHYDVIYKVVLVGDSGVGKTNILLRSLNKEFNQNTKATVGVEFDSFRGFPEGIGFDSGTFRKSKTCSSAWSMLVFSSRSPFAILTYLSTSEEFFPVNLLNAEITASFSAI